MESATIRVLVFQDDGLWVAQCLEYDIGAQAPDPDTLRDRLDVTLKAELKESFERGLQPFAGLEPAPERFQLMWEHRARSLTVSATPRAPTATASTKTAANQNLQPTLDFAFA